MATTNLTSIKSNAFTNVVSTIVTTLGVSAPKITTIDYPDDSTATSIAGGETVTLIGSGFNSGASVLINGSFSGVVTVVDSTTLTFTAPAQVAGTYPIYVINTDGSTAISVPGINYSGVPTWSTSSGSLATLYEFDSVNSTVTATGDATVSYSLFSGTLPTGSSLNTSTGAITGTSVATGSPTTYSFVIRATDGQNQDTDRSFSITINPDAVTWSSPADGYATNLPQNLTMSTFTMSAASAAGRSITYTANSLPTGLSISGATIVGTPTVIANSGSLITATAATTGRTATRTFNWSVVVANDTYWPYTSLLLNGEGAAAANNAQNISYVDGSTNAFTVTRFGDTYQGTNSPFSGGSFSNYFPNAGSISTASSAVHNLGTGDFTVELWYNQVAHVAYGGLFMLGQYNTGIHISLNISSYTVYCGTSGSTVFNGVSGPVVDGQWTHVALTRSGTTLTLWHNGVSKGSVSNSATLSPTAGITIGATGHNPGSERFNGYISNVRLVKGTCLYTSTFTPSTTELTAITGTTILTCQSNRFKDNSENNWPITVTGTISVSKYDPFPGATEYSPTTHGGSAYFDGAGDYLTVPANAAFSFGTGDFTIETWVYASVSNAFVGQGAATSAFGLGINSGGFPYASVGIQYGGAAEGGSITLTAPTGLKFTSVLLAGYGSNVNYTGGPNYVYGTVSGTSRSFVESALLGNTGAITIGANNSNFGDPTPGTGKSLAVLATVGLLSSTACNINSWNHLVLARSGTALTLYLNGVSVATATYSTAVGSSSNTVSIGATTASGSAIFPTTGSISNLRIVKGSAVYTSAFTPPTSPVTAISGTSLLMNFTNAGIIDQTGVNNIITVGDAKISTVQKKYGSSSMYFDGTADYLIATPNFNFGTGDVTMECWIYANSLSGSAFSICGTHGAVTDSKTLLYVYGTGSIAVGKIGVNEIASATGVITTGTWYHVAAVRNGSTTTVYVNGTSVATNTTAVWDTNTSPFTVAYMHPSNGLYWNGYIDDLRITKGVARYTTTFTPPTTALFTK